jgi:hypothetical protein
MAWYRTGTANVTTGSNAVVGNASLWSTGGIKPGDVFTVDNVTLYEIQAATDDTHLTLDRPFAGVSTGAGDFAAYAIIQNFSPYPQTVLSTLSTLSAQYATLLTGIGTMANQSKTAVQILGGTIDGTTIGGTNPGAGSFTTLTVAKAQNGTTTGLLVSNNSNGTNASAQMGASNGTNGVSLVQLGTGVAAAGAIQAGGAYIGASNGLALTANAGPVTFGTSAAEWGRFNPTTFQLQVPAGFTATSNQNSQYVGLTITNSNANSSASSAVNLSNGTTVATFELFGTGAGPDGAIQVGGAVLGCNAGIALTTSTGPISFGTGADEWGRFNPTTLQLQVPAGFLAAVDETAAFIGMTVANTSTNASAQAGIQVSNGTDTLNMAYTSTLFGGAGAIQPSGGYISAATSLALVVGSGPLTFGTSSSEFARFDTSGRLGIKIIPAAWDSSYATVDIGIESAVLDQGVNGMNMCHNAYVSGGSWKYKAADSTAILQCGGSTGMVLYTAPTGTANAAISSLIEVFQVATNGNVTNSNNSYGAISDAVLKQDVTPANDQWADVKAIAAVMKRYRLKADVAADPNAPYQLGVLAQDVQKISPGLIDTDPKGLLSVKYSIMTLKGLVALGAALARIEALEAKTAKLAA